MNTLGVDIGTSSSKGVLVDHNGTILATAVREHTADRPLPGHVEMPAELWWEEFQSITRELLASATSPIAAVGVSGMGPCVLITDADDQPLRPAILYGVDTRSSQQISELNAALGAEEILERCGVALSSQAAGPKLAWIAANEPTIWARARRYYQPASWLAARLTGAYVLDHQSASQSTPLYDTRAQAWYEPWADQIRGPITLPPLGWAGEQAGTVTAIAAEHTGLPEGTPVTIGTIDAWSEAVSVGAVDTGDLMLMYGTTMFLLHTTDERTGHPQLWGTVGVAEGQFNLAAGMATSGAITGWLRELYGSPDYPTLLAEAALSPPGARGLLMLPYFAGERTPINDPDARGTIVGLTLTHQRGDLYRAALEATALGVRHNLELFRAAGAHITRVVAVGGGTQGDLWPRIVSDVTGLEQVLCREAVGASLGAAFLAAGLHGSPDISQWNPAVGTILPDPANRAIYDEVYADYLALYPAIQPVMHRLAARQAGRELPRP